MTMNKDAALRAGREPIELWPLMLWAYRPIKAGGEMVRFTCGSDFRPASVSQSTLAWVMAAAASGVIEGDDDDGSGYSFAPCAHVDALGLHGHVLRVIERQERGAPRRQAFELLILHAEAGALPTFEPVIDPPRYLPVLRAGGKVKHLFDKRGHALACEVYWSGHSPAQAAELRARARERYSDWIGLLDAVLESLGREQLALSRYRITGLGVPRNPWLSRNMVAA